jgi:SRSO17 transposase
MVAEWTVSLLEREAELARLKAVVGAALPRRELRESAGAFVDGLLSGVERKTGWLMAEQAGLDRPYRMQSLLGRSSWSADDVRDVVRAYALEALGDPDGALVVDETGFLKKGEHSVGVARQYSGAAGRIENSQVGVFVAYASRFGQALIDRRLYLPESWASDAERRRQSHVPEEVVFATKIAMARELIAAALDAGAPCRWVLADALYGGDYRLRHMLEIEVSPMCLRSAPTKLCACCSPRVLSKPIPRQSPMSGLRTSGRRWPPEKVRRACGSMNGRVFRCRAQAIRNMSVGC